MLSRLSPPLARALSLLSLIVIALAGTSFYAIGTARQADQRGIALNFPQPVRGAEQLLLGVNAPLDQYDEATLEARLTLLTTHNVRYVRQEFRWADIEKQKGHFDWAAADRVFQSAQKHKLQLLAVLLTTPQWARPNSGSAKAPSPESSPPQDEHDFAVFAQAFATRYGDKGKGGKGERGITVPPSSAVLAYQIWDEPNLSSGWGNNLINPAAYLKLLLAAGDAIREVNPNARIVLGSLAPTVEMSQINLAPHAYLQRLYQLGAHDAFDIVAAKPYGYNFSANDRRVDAGLLNFSQVLLLRETMDAHGENQKAIWATEFGWNSLPQTWRGEKTIWGNVIEAQQAAFTTDAINRAASEWPWLGAMFVDSLEPRTLLTASEGAGGGNAEWGFAMLDQQGQPRPVFNAFTQAITNAMLAPRANLFALCDVSPRLVAKVLDPNKMGLGSRAEAINAIPNLGAPCYWPNPLATFSPGWRFSELGADMPGREYGSNDAKVTIPFSGDDFALIVRRAGREYRAYTFVTIDGKPANLLPQEPRGAYLIMNTADYAARVETIPVASALGPGPHLAEITMDGGWNLWGLVGWSSRFQISDFRFRIGSWFALFLGVAGVMGLAWVLPRARWRDVFAGLPARVGFRPQAWHAALLGALTWLTASLTWAQDAATAYRNLNTPAPLVISALTSALAFWSPLYVLSLIALAALFILVLLRLDLGLMLLAFFIPFYLQPQRLFAYSFSMVELLTVMCVASWLIGRLRINDWRLRGQPFDKLRMQSQISNLKSLSLLDWSVIALVIIAFASSLQAQFKVEAFRELRVVIAESAVFYFLLRTSNLNEAQRWRILDGFILAATSVALIGLFNYARGDRFIAEFGLPRIKSIYGSPNNDALFLGRAFAVLLAVAIAGREAWNAERGENQSSSLHAPRSTLYLLALLPVTLALLLSQSRGALLLGMPAAVFVVCWLSGGRWRWVAVALGLGLVLSLAILLSGVAAPWVQGTRLENALDLQRGTGFFRINVWQSALRMIADHPLLGVGPDNFLYAYRSFYILPAAWQEPTLSHPHNFLLDFASRLGLLGFIAGMFMFIGFARNLKLRLPPSANKPGFCKKPGLFARPATHRIMQIAFAGLLAEMLAHGLVDHSLFLVDLAFVFMLAAGLSHRKDPKVLKEP